MVLSNPRDVDARTQFRSDHNTSSISSSWGNHNSICIRILFVLGEDHTVDADTDTGHGQHQHQQQPLLELEARRHQDILQLNHPEDYRAIVFKVLGGFLWVSQYCRTARHIVKTDSNAKLDLDYIVRALLLPGGSNPQQQQQQQQLDHEKETLRVECPFPFRLGKVNRPTPHHPHSITGKWAVSAQQFPQNICPDYCPGWMYSITAAAALALVEASTTVPWDVAWREICPAMKVCLLRDFCVKPLPIRPQYRCNPCSTKTGRKNYTKVCS